MGNCCNSGDGTKKQVKLYMKSSGIYEIDELFRSAAAPLSTLDDTNSSLSPKALAKATYTYILNDLKLLDAIKGMLFIYSAESNGDLSSLDFKFDTSNPFIGIDRSKLPIALRPISDAWDNLVTGLETAPDKLKDIPDQLRVLAEEAKEFPEKAKDLCSSKGLGPMEVIKVMQNISKNVGRITGAKQVLEETNQTISELKDTLSRLQETFNEEEMEKIKQVGIKAKSENSTTPRAVITKYWPEQPRINLALETPPQSK